MILECQLQDFEAVEQSERPREILATCQSFVTHCRMVVLDRLPGQAGGKNIVTAQLVGGRP